LNNSRALRLPACRQAGAQDTHLVFYIKSNGWRSE